MDEEDKNIAAAGDGPCQTETIVSDEQRRLIYANDCPCKWLACPLQFS